MGSIRHRLRAAGTALVLLAFSGAALAHHSFAMFDHDHQVRMTGKVKDFRWQNPHVYFYMDVEDANGKVTNWSMEMGAPGALRPSGWTKNTLKIGDVVTVEGTPAKDGGHHGNARNVFLASTGQKLGAASSEGQTAAPKGKQ